MSTRSFVLVSTSFALASLLALGGCQTGQDGEATETVAVSADSAIAVDTFTTTATVAAIDVDNRTLTLTAPDGRRTTCKAGPAVANFEQIRVGDRVKATVTEEYAVLLSRGHDLSLGVAQTVALAPVGAKPGLYVANVAETTARVESVDAQHHKATLQFVDGRTRTVRVGRDIDLSDVRPGDDVTVRVAESIAVAVEKP